MARPVFVPFGRLAEHLAALPEAVRARTATRRGVGAFDDYTVRQWTSRGAMATAVRMSEKGNPDAPTWRAAVPLSESEGY